MPVSYQFLRFLLISSFPQHPALSISPSLTRFKLIVASSNTVGLINSWCSAPRLWLALTQTATNW
ncbi:unnamed protein product [Hymenolepis diminuta]|uniref:Uncharacterized protein n=1 Tax=Hymenolepis diminuta TaxID=6216 RepID=A0A564YMF2_HYMDI|nr:unnamed protein product [Hymenolepis diminuta]